MIFEGVLTESVRDEKLFVSFTVEGYFHYVLGEVIEKKSQGKGPEYFKGIIEESNLKGAREGSEQCLIREVISGQCDRFFSLIDLGGKSLNHCVLPLSALFLSFSRLENTNSCDSDHKKNYFRNIIHTLLENPTENDYIVLLNTFFYFDTIQKNKAVLSLYEVVSDLENYSSINFLTIIIKSMPYVSMDIRLKLLQKIELESQKFKTEDIYPEIIFELGTQYLIHRNFDKSILLYEESYRIFQRMHGDYESKIEKIISNLGAVYWYSGDIEKTREYFNLSYNQCLKMYGPDHSSTGGALQNLALVRVLEENYDEAIEIFQKAVNINLKIYGFVHPDTARVYSNIGSAYLRKSEYKAAYNYFTKALVIDKNIFHETHPCLGLDYDDIGDVHFFQGDMSTAKEHYEKSKSIFMLNYGSEYPHIQLLDEKLGKTNDH
jgi:tetratricopeptide (TPR) repeat protein